MKRLLTIAAIVAGISSFSSRSEAGDHFHGGHSVHHGGYSRSFNSNYGQRRFYGGHSFGVSNAHGYDHDPSHYDHYGHVGDDGQGHSTYQPATLNRHHPIPIHAGSECPLGYGNGEICSDPEGCPLGRDRGIFNRLNDEDQRGIDYEVPMRNHSQTYDNRSGQFYEGQSLRENSQRSPLYSEPQTPSGRGNLSPPALPRGPMSDSPPRQELRREQPTRDGSIRMDSPPPQTIRPSLPAPSKRGDSKQFDTPSL